MANDLLAKKRDESFESGIQTLVAIWNKRRAPMEFAEGEELPPLDVNLAEYRFFRIEPEHLDPIDEDEATPFARRTHEFNMMFAGKSYLCALNAMLIANLRRESAPAQAAPLFRRLWQEEDQTLFAELDGRWLISSVITFATHGETEADRRIGQSLNVLFSLMKLYESERLYDGNHPDQAAKARRRSSAALPMDMLPYDLLSGDLQANFLAPLWVDALHAPGAGRLAQHLLTMLNKDSRNIFRRMAVKRDGIIGEAY